MVNPTTDPISKVEFGKLVALAEETNDRIKRLETIIVGNGVGNGLLSRAEALEVRVNLAQESSNRVKTLVYGIVASLSLSGVGVVAGLLTHKITIAFP